MKLSTTRVFVSARRPPHVLKQVTPGDGLALAIDEGSKQAHLANRQLDHAIRCLEFETVEVNRRRADREGSHRIRLGVHAVPSSSAQQAAHPREQLIEMKGFRQVIIRAVLDPSNQILGGILGGEHEDRYEISRSPNALRQLESTHARQHHVENHEVEGFASSIEGPLAGGAVLCNHDHVALGLEVETQPLREVRLVFYDQDPTHPLPTVDTPLETPRPPVRKTISQDYAPN